jgi:hypothetical protein
VGGLQRIRAGQFERAVERAQAAFIFGNASARTRRNSRAAAATASIFAIVAADVSPL